MVFPLQARRLRFGRLRERACSGPVAGGLFAFTLLSVPPPTDAAAATPGWKCAAAASRAEQVAKVPHGLLLAIGDVESGRRDPTNGQLLPWPWSLNIAGSPQFFPDLSSAASALRRAFQSGVRSIDVGCFQVNLMYHPDAFRSFEEALDPDANAAFAAQLLVQLRAMGDGWDQAVARYHSIEPSRGLPYLADVVALWHGGPAMRSQDSDGPASNDLFAVRVAAVWGAVRLPVVWDGARSGAKMRGVGQASRLLPNVITPMGQ